MARRYKQRGEGPVVNPDGYHSVLVPGHPLARSDGYVFVHRKVAWDAGLFNDPTLEVHHRNGDKTDNRLENLEVVSGAEHTELHLAERGFVTNQYGTFPLRAEDDPRNLPRPERVCPECGCTFNISRRRDAIYCSARCRITTWKRTHR